MEECRIVTMLKLHRGTTELNSTIVSLRIDIIKITSLIMGDSLQSFDDLPAYQVHMCRPNTLGLHI